MIKFTASIIVLFAAPLIGFIIGRKMGLRDAAVTVEAEFADLIVMSGMIIEKGRIVPR
jgi:hypothetical protein